MSFFGSGLFSKQPTTRSLMLNERDRTLLQTMVQFLIQLSKSSAAGNSYGLKKGSFAIRRNDASES